MRDPPRPNDLPLLTAVNIPILVQRPGGRWHKLKLSGVKAVEGIGPVGWTRAVEWLLAGRKNGLH